jgi:hypothetical protein
MRHEPSVILALLGWFVCWGACISLAPAEAQIGKEELPAIPQQKFPDWMDNVSFPSDGRKIDQEPSEPTDPNPKSEIKAPQGPSSRTRFQFQRPKLPDFSQLRKKATKMQYQRDASGSLAIASESVEMVNVDESLRKLNDLEARLQQLPPGSERELLEKMRDHQKLLTGAMTELSRLVNGSGAITLKDDPGRAKKIEDLKKIIFPDLTDLMPAKTAAPSAASGVGITSSEHEDDAAGENKPFYRIPRQFERPSAPSSLYLERKKEREEESEH